MQINKQGDGHTATISRVKFLIYNLIFWILRLLQVAVSIFDCNNFMEKVTISSEM